MSAHARLTELGLRLPEVPTPAAGYRVASRSGSLLYSAGQLPVVDGVLAATGRLGDGLTTAEGAELARTAALNLLAIADEAAGLERVRVVKLTVFVASTPDFLEQHRVADGASGLLTEVLGEAGVHARSAVGVTALPLGAPVEVEAILEVTADDGAARRSS